MSIEDQVAALREAAVALQSEVAGLRAEVTSLRAENANGQARIESRLPPLLGDRSRVREVTGLSDSSITRRTRTGEIKTILVGGRRLYDLSQFSPAGREEIQALAVEARQ